MGDGGTILHTSNGGATWSAQASGTTNNLFGVSFVVQQETTAVPEPASLTLLGLGALGLLGYARRRMRARASR